MLLAHIDSADLSDRALVLSRLRTQDLNSACWSIPNTTYRKRTTIDLLGRRKGSLALRCERNACQTHQGRQPDFVAAARFVSPKTGFVFKATLAWATNRTTQGQTPLSRSSRFLDPGEETILDRTASPAAGPANRRLAKRNCAARRRGRWMFAAETVSGLEGKAGSSGDIQLVGQTTNA